MEQMFKLLNDKINNGDSTYLKSLCVLKSQTETMSDGQLTSALMKFGKVEYEPLKKGYSPAAASLLKKSQRFKINCQPTAVQRRVRNSEGAKVESKRALPKGGYLSLVPVLNVPLKKKGDIIHRSASHNNLELASTLAECERITSQLIINLKRRQVDDITTI